MPGIFRHLLQLLRERYGTDMAFLCHHLLSERGEASQTALAQKIVCTYDAMNDAQKVAFFDLLSREFSPDEGTVLAAIADYQREPGPKTLASLSAALEPPRQELIRRINTAPNGTKTLVTLREHLLDCKSRDPRFDVLDADLKHLFKAWFNRGFLTVERISWQTSALVLEKLIQYESVHEINGWPDLRRRLEADRRCFAFFHPALVNEPVIFVEVALANGIPRYLEPLLDINAPVAMPEKADTAIFYSINNCLKGLRGIPFGNFLIKQVVDELARELPDVRTYCTLSPLPHFVECLQNQQDEYGFTRERLSRLLAEYTTDLTQTAERDDVVDAFFELLKEPLSYRQQLSAPLQRLALAYLTQARRHGKLYDPVATFHLANGARIEQINTFGNLRSYGLKESFGVMVNYRYLPNDLEENHELFVTRGQIPLSASLLREHRVVTAAWNPGPLSFTWKRVKIPANVSNAAKIEK